MVRYSEYKQNIFSSIEDAGISHSVSGDSPNLDLFKKKKNPIPPQVQPSENLRQVILFEDDARRYKMNDYFFNGDDVMIITDIENVNFSEFIEIDAYTECGFDSKQNFVKFYNGQLKSAAKLNQYLSTMVLISFRKYL